MQVRVLPPVPTDGWTVEELDEQVDEVREHVRRTRWPTGRGAARGRSTVTEAGRGRRGAAPPAAPLDWGIGAGDEPAGDGDVARRRPPTRGCGPTSRCWSCSSRRRTGSGCGPRTSGRRGWCRGCASGWSSPRSASARPRWVTVEELDLDRHLRRVRLDAPGSMRAAARRRRRVRRRAARPRPAAVGGAARRGPRRRAGRATSSRRTTARPTGSAPSS